jgi:hypothetical protein
MIRFSSGLSKMIRDRVKLMAARVERKESKMAVAQLDFGTKN